MLGAEASTRNPRLDLKQSLNRRSMSRSAFVLGCWFALGFSNYGRVACELQDADMQTNRGPCEAAWATKVSRYESYVQALERLEDSRGPHMEQWNGKRAYDMYEPEWTCESEVRVGPNEVNVGDGPKFVCGIETLKYEPECLVYSIGSNYNFQFEMGVRKYAENCEFHVFDGTMNLAKRPLPQDLSEKGIQFHNWNVQVTTETGGKGYPSRGLEDILRDLNHVGKTIHIFKIDCEGCEYKVLASLANMVLNGTVEVGQIQVEVHGTNAAHIQELFRNLRHAGFMIFHKERNHWGCQGYKCVEYALVSMSSARIASEEERYYVASPSKWWEQLLKESKSRGNIVVESMPLKLTGKNDKDLLILLCHAGVQPENNTLVDVGLPTESLTFASHGYSVHGFEPRESAYNDVLSRVKHLNLQHLITLHNVALGNQSGQSNFWIASDSSSLMESAIRTRAELRKFKKSGEQVIRTRIERLDTYVQHAAGMKLDTQGTEPELLMGSEMLFKNKQKAPKVILMEYCGRLRPFETLEVGPHLLRALGYICYVRQEKSFTLDKDTSNKFCGDLLFLHDPFTPRQECSA